MDEGGDLDVSVPVDEGGGNSEFDVWPAMRVELLDEESLSDFDCKIFLFRCCLLCLAYTFRLSRPHCLPSAQHPSPHCLYLDSCMQLSLG